ncbi:Outer membrane receptor proteins, mostly Fe transport [Flexibacter flexilis DSM 6793]|uniref:Outer membrane receptor proteins, mostly Fe transport n=1 Tax=Flexibacter flexilis DSM 6793 TaxID=927664 RepID=A0A1I1LPU7_9BACT|nr:TonB-dependent receptor [Flexibacter flexilis]SFC75134.1 Outer membrane receptor proteins, mostly Fe transport [Flexibacter flexilis DSM 6793]
MKQLFRTNSLLTFLMALLWTATAQAQNTQTVRGKLTDAASKAPIIGASVVVVDSNPLKGAASDIDGYFKITEVPVGRVTLKITSVGYEDALLKDIVVNSGKEVVLDLALTESFRNLDEVVVTYDRAKDDRVSNNEMATVSTRAFNPSETTKYAGSFGDPSRMAANFAGVSGANDARNDIVVRGNSPASLLWRIDGVNIPNPNHFGSLGTTGGPVSMINANLLAKSDFMTGAFPAEYANALGSVFDLRLRNGNDEKHEFLGQVAFNGFELGAEGPFSKKSKASFLVNYRYSVFALMNSIGFKIAGTPYYQDFTAKINVPVGKRGNFSTWFIGGKSHITFLGKDVAADADAYGSENLNSRPKFNSYMGAATYEHRLSDKTVGKFTLSTSRSYQDYSSDTVVYNGTGNDKQVVYESLNQKALFKNEKYSANLSLSHKFNSRHRISGGVITDLMLFDFTNTMYPTVAKPYESQILNVNGNTTLTQAYGQWKYRATEKLTFNSGLTYLYHALSSKSALEPRVGASYLLNSVSTLNFAYGLHSNLQPAWMYFIQTRQADGSYLQTNKNLGFTKSHHFVAGYERNLTENLRLKLETYYQYVFDAPIENDTATYFSGLTQGADFAPTVIGNLVNKGKGQNYGVELTLEKLLSNNYFFLLTTSLFNSTYKGSDNVERSTPFNSKYVINVLAGKDFLLGSKKNVFTISWKLTTAGGRYIRPVNKAASDLAGTTVYDDANAYSKQQAAYFRTDLKFSYKINSKHFTQEFALDLQNVTNHQNIYQQAYNPRTKRVGTAYQQGFLPIPFYRITF